MKSEFGKSQHFFHMHKNLKFHDKKQLLDVTNAILRYVYPFRLILFIALISLFCASCAKIRIGNCGESGKACFRSRFSSDAPIRKINKKINKYNKKHNTKYAFLKIDYYTDCTGCKSLIWVIDENKINDFYFSTPEQVTGYKQVQGNRNIDKIILNTLSNADYRIERFTIYSEYKDVSQLLNKLKEAYFSSISLSLKAEIDYRILKTNALMRSEKYKSYSKQDNKNRLSYEIIEYIKKYPNEPVTHNISIMLMIYGDVFTLQEIISISEVCQTSNQFSKTILTNEMVNKCTTIDNLNIFLSKFPTTERICAAFNTMNRYNSSYLMSDFIKLIKQYRDLLNKSADGKELFEAMIEKQLNSTINFSDYKLLYSSFPEYYNSSEQIAYRKTKEIYKSYKCKEFINNFPKSKYKTEIATLYETLMKNEEIAAAKKRERNNNSSSSSDYSSSSSSDNYDKKSEVDYENIEHPGVDKVDDWEEQNTLYDGRHYVTEVTFEDGITGFLYKGGSSGDHFIENSGGANYYYKNYDAALRALYVYKKYGEIIKKGAK